MPMLMGAINFIFMGEEMKKEGKDSILVKARPIYH
jgi:hypothetical protein